jgi:threonine dehydratase
MTDPIFEKILAARVHDVAKTTPLEVAPLLGGRVANHVFFKREDLQSVHSFKLRGAYNKMISLSLAERKRGVIAASAGNHAQGVALAAKVLKCRAVIVMPATTPSIKTDAVKAYGAKVVLVGDSYAEAYEHALKLAKKEKLVYVHAYDDVEVIAGQGTIGIEVLQQSHTPPDVIFIPIGGGGLAAGIATYVKHVSPKTKIIGVEPVDANAMQLSLKAGRIVDLDYVGLFAEGVAVKKVGKETFRLCKKYVDDVVLVTTDEICAAIKDVFDETRTILEPSGALSVAGLHAYVKKYKLKNKNLVCILSGANMNFERLHHVAERAEVGEKREALFAVTIPERPGSFKKLITIIGARMITEFNYRYNDPKAAHVFMGMRIHSQNEIQTLLKKLKAHGFAAINLTENEMAVLHLRHLVGGPPPKGTCEVLYRCEFPERVGALKNFLSGLSASWNISLFHYRNHGTDYGRVLVGLQILPNERKKVAASLNRLGYVYHDETQNPACKLFLS